MLNPSKRGSIRAWVDRGRRSDQRAQQAFGYTLQLVQDSSGVILHYEVHRGNPSDRTEPLSVLRQAKTGVSIKPNELAADRGYYSRENVLKLSKAGIEKLVLRKWVA